ncbi:hypothetical protein Y1Q_0021022 [Alligator mississippiensis]|uniref:Uncharacterized protein n=1 Tax=Alligator mississippiensis TaxID=8496 RepID=A0A151M5F0_ALLMI|nr:hypothetical protein Y1Q_0021022 [Alligator mississippiensis]
MRTWHQAVSILQYQTFGEENTTGDTESTSTEGVEDVLSSTLAIAWQRQHYPEKWKTLSRWNWIATDVF